MELARAKLALTELGKSEAVAVGATTPTLASVEEVTQLDDFPATCALGVTASPWWKVVVVDFPSGPSETYMPIGSVESPAQEVNPSA